MSDQHNALHAEYLKGQAQFTYFLLGVAASAVAFAIHQTNGRRLSETPWLYGFAVLFWAVSFAIGCFGIQSRQSGIAKNYKFLDLMKKTPIEYQIMPDIAKSIKDFEKDVSDSAWAAQKKFIVQQWLFFVGAIAYMGGHILDMANK